MMGSGDYLFAGNTDLFLLQTSPKSGIQGFLETHAFLLRLPKKNVCQIVIQRQCCAHADKMLQTKKMSRHHKYKHK